MKITCKFQSVIILGVLLIMGCSAGQSPITPGTDPSLTGQNSIGHTNRTVWGYWNIRIEQGSKPVNILPNRDAELHLNIVSLLEVSPCNNCLSISNVYILPDNILQCDFQLKHPFTDAPNLTGFDVRAVLVTDGDTLFESNDLLASLNGSNPYFIDPDGYTSLFNPVDYPSGTAPSAIFGYYDGKFASSDNLTGTLNPYMAFCKTAPRRMFDSGATETVTLSIRYPSMPFEFGYVVDASWMQAADIVDPETDFPPEANCLEPYELDFQADSELTEEVGDSVDVQVEVFDHQGLDTISTVSVECQALFDGAINLDYVSESGDDSWLYGGTISNDNGAPVGSYPLLVKSVSLDGDPVSGELAAYAIEDISVLSTEPWISVHEPDGDETYIIGGSGEIKWASNNVTGHVKIEYTTADTEPPIEITTATDNDGIYTWEPIPDTPTTEGRVIISSVDNPSILDQSDDYFTIAEQKSITVIAPNGGETLYGDESYEIQWEWTGDIDSVYIFYSVNSGTDYDGAVAVNTDCTGSFEWDPIPPVDTTQARIKIIDVADNSIYDQSDADFTMSYLVPCDGDLVFARRAGGTDEDNGRDVVRMPDDSFAVTGYFSGTATFGPDEVNETILTSYGGRDIFVARYNADGTLAWVKQAGGVADDEGMGITVLSYNPLVVTGYFKDTATFGKDETNETSLVSAGNSDIFVAKYNPNGTLGWVKRAGGSDNDSGYAITTRSDNTTIVTGYFKNTAIFGKDETFETPLVSAGESDIFIARYRDDSILEWAKRAGGSDFCYGDKITVLSDNSTIISGHFKGTATFGPDEPDETDLVSYGDYDIFLARFDSLGVLQWARHAGGAYGDFGRGIVTLSDGSVVVTGGFRDDALFGEGEADETTLVTDGQDDIFVARYYPNGNLVWATQAGGTNTDGGHGVALLSDDSTTIVGNYYESATFGIGEVNETTLVSEGQTDTFVARYNTDGTLAWVKSAGGPLSVLGWEIASLSDDSSVATGRFYDSATFGIGEPNETCLVSDGNTDIFIAGFIE